LEFYQDIMSANIKNAKNLMDVEKVFFKK